MLGSPNSVVVKNNFKKICLYCDVEVVLSEETIKRKMERFYTFFIFNLNHGIFLEHGRFFIIIHQRMVFNQNFRLHALDYDIKGLVCRGQEVSVGILVMM